jgi:hypothetical protein
MMAAKPPIWVALRAHLAADRKKTAVLVVLSVVMLGIYARLFWGSSPAQAGAATPLTAVVPNSTGVTSAQPAALVRIKPAHPLVRDLARDPFAVRLDRFQVDPSVVTTRPSGSKAPTAQAAERPGAVQQEFRLQSTISGTLPMAWINGRCVQPGEAIDGFVLEQIEPTRVVLRRGNDVRVLTID